MNWQQDLTQNLREVEDLLPYMPLNEAEQRQMRAILEQFPMAVTKYYLSLIDFNDPDDPIRKMAIPSIAETDLSGSFDTSGEAGNTVVPGLQHKYRETALLLSTNQCAMYCRHCFRKRLVGSSDEEVARQFSAMRAYLLAHNEITNVVVSGGDALLCSNQRLSAILDMLADIPHIRAIRIASRIPVVLPGRITGDDDLLALLAKYNTQKQLYLVTQFNHPKELTAEAVAAMKAVQSIGIPVKNQTVLLRGVNDKAEVLGKLLNRLVEHGVAPYYVFQCRPVSGVKNQFQVPLAQAINIVEGAKALQNGMGKCFRFCLSHVTGKVEILGKAAGGEMLFKYHEAANPCRLGSIFSLPVKDNLAWLPDDFSPEERPNEQS